MKTIVRLKMSDGSHEAYMVVSQLVGDAYRSEVERLRLMGVDRKADIISVEELDGTNWVLKTCTVTGK